MAELTQDSFFEGRLLVSQKREGYRFSIDAVLLAAAVMPQPGDCLLDLGTGSGIIPLILALRYPTLRISGVEIQPELASLAQKNVRDNHMEGRIVILRTDMRALPADDIRGPFDWVVSNPPYHKKRSGRINPNSERALARHEIMVDVEQVIACAQRMLRIGGHLVTIYAVDRFIDLVDRMRQAGIEPKYIQSVHSNSGQEAKLVLVHGIKSARPGLRVAAPLTIYRSDGKYTERVLAMMKP